MHSTGHAEIDGESANALVVPLSCSLAGTETTINFQEGSKCSAIYGKSRVLEKFRCNYGLSPAARKSFDSANLRITGTDDANQVVTVELINHPFFVGTLFQPQLSSAFDKPHPLLDAFLKAAEAYGKPAARQVSQRMR